MIPLKKCLLLCFLAICIVLPFTAGTQADSPPDNAGTFRNGELVAEIRPGASIDAVNARNRTSTIQRISGTNFYRLLVPADKRAEKWIKRLAADRDVLSASLNPVVTSPIAVFSRSTVGFPGGRPKPGHFRDEYLSQPGLFALLHLGDVRLRSTGAGVVIAVIDTGIDRTHPDLAAHLWVDTREPGLGGSAEVDGDSDGFINDAYGWDFIDDDNDPGEQAASSKETIAGHGTFIAGLIALIAPDAQIMPVRAFTPEGISNAFTVAAAIKYAADHGAGVINLSFGSPNKSHVVRDAIKYAVQRGATLVAAVGNEDHDTDIFPSYPANLKRVLGIAAIDGDSRKAAFSNFGSRVAVSAPGVGLMSTFPGADGRSGDYAQWSGTSFAAPLASSEAALILAEDRSANAANKIKETAFPIDAINADLMGKLGKGRVDPVAALDSIYMDPSPAGNYASIKLVSPSAKSKAEGYARIAVTGRRQELEIIAHGLDPRAACGLIVDGKSLVPEGFTSSNFGGLALEFSNRVKGETAPGSIRFHLPAALNPVTSIRHIELISAGQILLQGDFAETVGGRPANGEIIEKKTPLSPTGILPDSAGSAYLWIAGVHQAITVKAGYLAAGASYTILADGVELGTSVAWTDSSKQGVFRFQLMRESPDGQNFPPLSEPLISITRIEVRDSYGQTILEGDFLPSN